MKPKKTFLDKKNEEYKAEYSKKEPNKARRHDLATRQRTSKAVSNAKTAK